jgi:thiol-disulfide isomerase/thioredoxin
MYMAGQQESQSLPDVTFRTYQNETVRTGDMKGNVLFVQLWATNCKSCRAMRAASERLNAQFAAQGVLFLSVNEDALQKAWEDSLIGKPSPLIEVRDEKHSFRRMMHVASLPAALIVDRSGHVRWRGSWTSASETKASEALARLLQEH